MAFRQDLKLLEESPFNVLNVFLGTLKSASPRTIRSKVKLLFSSSDQEHPRGKLNSINTRTRARHCGNCSRHAQLSKCSETEYTAVPVWITFNRSDVLEH